MRPLIVCALAIFIISIVSSCQKEFTIDDVPVTIDSLPVDSLPTDTLPGMDTTKILQILSITPDSAKAGDTVLITGRGFSAIGSTGSVTINGLPLSIIKLTDTTLAVKLPAGFTSGPVSIVTGDTAIISIINIIAKTQDTAITTSPWKERASISFPAGDDPYVFGFGASIGIKGYFFNGSLKEFDPASNTWTRRPGSPVDFSPGFAFVLDGKLYEGSGIGSNDQFKYAKQVWAYDPTTETWTRKADFPGAARLQPFAFSTSSYGYVGGGDASGEDLNFNDFWRYDAATDTWKQMNDYPGNKINYFEQFSGFTINNSGYVFESGTGPLRAPIGDAYSNNVSLWKYDESNDSWQQRATFDKYQNYNTSSVFTIGDKAYLTIGTIDSPVVNGEVKTNNFWEYNAITNTWIQRTDVPGGDRPFSKSFSIGDKGYVGLGAASVFDVHSDFYEYIPE
jgi:N-acetylneuraminic acid mutarotase